jgi:hypothetical protein
LQQGKKWGEWQNAKKDETGEDLATVGTTAATFFSFLFFFVFLLSENSDDWTSLCEISKKEGNRMLLENRALSSGRWMDG